MTQPAYQALALNSATLASITQRFGSTPGTKKLQQVFGANWLQTFLQYQHPGESCVYYLAAPLSLRQALQLCFNGANVLVSKQVIPAG